MRSESCTASVMLWVMSSVVCLSCCWICSTLSPSRSRVCSSSAANGSSISMIFGCAGQRARHRHALAHAAGELGRIAPLEAVEPDQRDEMPRPLVALGLRHAGDLQREGHIVDHGAPGKGRLLLEDHADRRMRAAHELARHLDGAVIAVEQPADDVEQRRLAAARRADHADELAGRDRQRNVVDRGDDAVRGLEPLGDVVDDQDGLPGRAFGAPAWLASRRHCHDSHGAASSPG